MRKPTLQIKAVLFLAAVVFSVSYLPEALASTAGGAKPMPYVAWLDNLRASTSGPVAYTLSLIGIIVSGGILIFGGDLNGFFRTLIFIVLVTALIVAADNTLRTLQAGAEITPPPNIDDVDLKRLLQDDGQPSCFDCDSGRKGTWR
jgi:type IV secretion system protein VirB2